MAPLYCAIAISPVIMHVYKSKHACHTLYSGKCSREKTFANIAIYSHPRKFSPLNLRHATPICVISLTFHENVCCEMLSSYQSPKVFSFKSFSLSYIWYMTRLRKWELCPFLLITLEPYIAFMNLKLGMNVLP